MTGTGCWPLAAFARAMEKHDAADSHDEVILDCSYNFHGTRLATCAADHRVIVWDQGSDGLWTRECKKLEKHSSAVFKVDWAHPEYGQILASCSADRTVVIWEETQDRNRERRWSTRAQLSDSRCPVVDVQFAPHHQGLKLAALSEDGCVRTYEAVDVMDLGCWQLREEFHVHAACASCLAWNPCRFDPPQLVVGATDQDDQPVVKVWQYAEDERAWRPKMELDHGGGRGAVRCVDWAPKMGRSFHYIATAHGSSVRVWQLETTDRQGKEPPTQTLAPIADEAAVEPSDAGEVWRVRWNITGTVLASSGDDGHVRLWKPDPISGCWTACSAS